MQKIKTGIIGCGFISQAHIEALRRLGYVEVVAAADKERALAEKTAHSYGIVNVYTDYKNMIQKESLDVVHILTPNKSHLEIVKFAAEYNLNVICEKPLALTKDEALEMLMIMRQCKGNHGIMHNMRYYPLVKHAREMCVAGDLGNVRLIHGKYLQDWLFYDTDFNWRVMSSQGGPARAIADIGTHWLDQVQNITGQYITEVFADLTTFIPVRKESANSYSTFSSRAEDDGVYNDRNVDTDDHGTVMLKFSDGAKGVFLVSQVSAGRKNYIEWEINGSRKSVNWCGESPNRLWIGERDRPNKELIKDSSLMYPEAAKYSQTGCGLGEGYLDTFKSLLSDYYEWLKAGKGMDEENVPFPTFLTGLMEMSIIEAILKSNETGRWVKVDYPFTGAY